MEIRESIRATYIDLDRLIEGCRLSRRQAEVVQLLMNGLSLTDIASEQGCLVSTISNHLDRAAEKISAENSRRWYAKYGKNKSPRRKKMS